MHTHTHIRTQCKIRYFKAILFDSVTLLFNNGDYIADIYGEHSLFEYNIVEINVIYTKEKKGYTISVRLCQRKGTYASE